MTTPPDADLLIASGCVHCPGVLSSLSELLKQGVIGRLNVTNLAVHPDAGRQRGARTVPWLQLGPFTLEGSRNATELRDWAEKATSAQGMRDYIGELLETQKLPEVLTLLDNDPHQLPRLTELLADLETPMGVRIGAGAVIEELAPGEPFTLLIPELGKLLSAPESQIRADAAYYLSLGDNPKIPTLLEPLLEDPDHEVRDIVKEALDQPT